MPTLIELKDGVAQVAEDAFLHVADDQDLAGGDVIVSLSRFQAEGESLLSDGRRVGVRLEAGEAVEALAYDLSRLALVALDFPKFGDGRSFSNARLLREGLTKVGIRVFGGVNAPYVWLKTPNTLGSWEFFDMLLNQAHVVGTPGSGFGAAGEGYFRLSAFNSRQNVEEALERIHKVLQ